MRSSAKRGQSGGRMIVVRSQRSTLRWALRIATMRRCRLEREAIAEARPNTLRLEEGRALTLFRTLPSVEEIAGEIMRSGRAAAAEPREQAAS